MRRHVHFTPPQATSTSSERSASPISKPRNSLRVNVHRGSRALRDRCKDAGLLIGVGRRQRVRRASRRLRRRRAAFRVGPLADDLVVAHLRRHPGRIVDAALLVMGAHVAALREPEAAIGAGVRFGAGVVVEMGLQVVLLRERFGAQGALVGLQTGVQSSVQGHVGAVGERLLTDLTLVRPLARVRAQMLLQQHLPRERLAALLALMRLHAGMYTHVHVVGHPLIEALAALRATVLLAIPVDLHVRAEITAIVEVLAAFRTGGGELPRTLVHATMILVVAQLGELLAAVGATEGLLAGVRAAVHLGREHRERVAM